jgi:adenine-specific DNA-methyltransferase
MDVPFRVLEHSYGFDNGNQTTEETGSGNKIIHGDNLEALKSLLPKYELKIKCIYIGSHTILFIHLQPKPISPVQD